MTFLGGGLAMTNAREGLAMTMVKTPAMTGLKLAL
jgi:hypothetical protein